MKSLKDHWIVSFLDNLPDGFFTLDREWRYTYVNKTFEKYENVTRDQILGKVMWEAFPTPDLQRTKYFSYYEQAMTSGQQVAFEEMVDSKWFEVRAFPISDGLAILYRDITDRKLADERKDEFIRLASHELKTPITSLRLYAELLLEQLEDDEEDAEYAQRIIDQSDRLTKLVTEMLDLSRMQLGKLQFKKRPFDLVELVEEVAAPLRPKSVAHKIITDYQATQALVYGDRHRIMEVVSNLIDNALKYSPGKEKIIITVTTTGEKIRFSVQDFGVGIDPAYKDRLFDRFYQAHGTKGKSFPGLGIGLYIAKAIADKHDGTIEVESTLGAGSTFSLLLPRHIPKK